MGKKVELQFQGDVGVSPIKAYVGRPKGVRALAVVGRAVKRGMDETELLDEAGPDADEKEIAKAVKMLQKKKKNKQAEKKYSGDVPYIVAQAMVAGKEVNRLLKELRATCKRLDDFTKSPFGSCVPAGQITDNIRKLAEQFKFAAPYSPCFACDSKGESKGSPCTACKKRGWLTKLEFSGLPKNLQDKREGTADDDD